MWTFVITSLVLVGTCMQAYAGFRDMARQHKDPIRESVAEDELLAELAWWRRFARREQKRELRAMRLPEVDWAIRQVNLVFAGWIVLVFAAAWAAARSWPF